MSSILFIQFTVLYLFLFLLSTLGVIFFELDELGPNTILIISGFVVLFNHLDKKARDEANRRR